MPLGASLCSVLTFCRGIDNSNLFADLLTQTCPVTQVVTSSSFFAPPAKWRDGITPTALQTRSHGCSHATHGAGPSNHPARSPASFSPFLSDHRFAWRQPAASFTEIEIALPPWLF